MRMSVPTTHPVLAMFSEPLFPLLSLPFRQQRESPQIPWREKLYNTFQRALICNHQS